jgi:hypothetical protein
VKGPPRKQRAAIALFDELVLMVRMFCACIEIGMMPEKGSPCHRRALWMVDESGQKPKRKRRRLPRKNP